VDTATLLKLLFFYLQHKYEILEMKIEGGSHPRQMTQDKNTGAYPRQMTQDKNRGHIHGQSHKTKTGVITTANNTRQKQGSYPRPITQDKNIHTALKASLEIAELIKFHKIRPATKVIAPRQTDKHGTVKTRIFKLLLQRHRKEGERRHYQTVNAKHC
jgi:hypothetical protein